MTLGALSLLGAARLRAPFPSLPGCDEVAFGAREAIAARLATRRYAALVVEPIQIEGGVRMPPDGWLAELAALCKKAGTLLVFDEVQTGIGRTGALFAFQRYGVVPDVLCYAKALSGGLIPIGGFSTSMEWHRRAHPRTRDFDLHSSTFGGGALACAVARRLLELVDEPLLARVRDHGEHLAARLASLARGSRRVAATRGLGLVHGVEMAPETHGLASALTLGVPNKIVEALFAHWVAVRLLERGFVTETATHDERVLRVEPPLTIERAELDEFVDALAEILDENRHFTAFVKEAGARLIGQAVRGAIQP
jgi:putrescine aminotransferase